jgi:hypothetical protein
VALGGAINRPGRSLLRLRRPDNQLSGPPCARPDAPGRKVVPKIRKGVQETIGGGRLQSSDEPPMMSGLRPESWRQSKEFTMPDLVQNAVGEKLYVWSQRHGKPTPDAKGRCIITAEGTQSIINSKFPVKDVQLIFYAPHGSLLKDPGIRSIMAGEKKSAEEVTSGDCQDYVLEKFRKGSESYDKIRGLRDDIEDDTQRSRVEFKKALNEGDDAATWKATLSLDGLSNWMDVVTIRHRPLMSDPMLSEVITTLHKAGYRYTTIHCVFCRGPQLPWLPEPKYEAPNAR